MIFNIAWDTFLVWIIAILAAIYLISPFFKTKKSSKKCDACTPPIVTNRNK